MPYATVDKVKLIACATADDLKKTAEEFDSLLSTLITWAAAEMNSYMKRSYTDEELAADADLAAALESVSVQAVDNFLQATVQRINSPIITVNDFIVKAPPRVILTPEMKEVLGRYSVKNLAVPVFNEGTYRINSGVTDLVTPNNSDEV